MRCVVGGCSTYSKVAWRDVQGYPQVILNAEGAEVQEGNGQWYIDWTASLGATLLGYKPPAVTLAVRTVLMDKPGVLLPGPHPLEEHAASQLCAAVGQEQLRWCKNGSDATEAAVRLARFVTGNKRILVNSYHGSHSDLIDATPGKAGGVLVECREEVIPLPTAERLLEWVLPGTGLAAVLIEPYTPDGHIWPLQEIVDAAHRAGALVIFDEIITGFRSRYGSAWPEVQPDLACFGKAIASGFPLACVTGPHRLMRYFEHDVFMSSTAAAELVSLAACGATIEILAQGRETLYRRLALIRVALMNALGPIVTESPGRLHIRLPMGQHRIFLSQLAQRGILVGADFFPMVAHTDAQVEQTVEAIGAARERIAS